MPVSYIAATAHDYTSNCLPIAGHQHTWQEQRKGSLHTEKHVNRLNAKVKKALTKPCALLKFFFEFIKKGEVNQNDLKCAPNTKMKGHLLRRLQLPNEDLSSGLYLSRQTLTLACLDECRQ